MDKHSLNHAAERATKFDAAARPIPDLLRSLHSTETGRLNETGLIHIKRANGLLVSIFPSEKTSKIAFRFFGFAIGGIQPGLKYDY